MMKKSSKRTGKPALKGIPLSTLSPSLLTKWHDWPVKEQVAFEIKGQLASKSNSRRLVKRKNGTTGNIKSAPAMAWAKEALKYLKKQWQREPLGEDVDVAKRHLLCMRVIVLYSTWRPDLDTTLLKDTLQKGGVIYDDRDIREHRESGYVKKGDPRTYVVLDLCETRLGELYVI
jgi:Holliday junction resolvase RusA-like endonuclease